MTTPTNDIEDNVLAYRSYEEPISKVLRRYAERTAKGMFDRIADILRSAGYDGRNALSIMIRPADLSVIRMLEELASRASDRDRQRLQAKLYGQMAGGSLTVRNAIRDVTEFGIYEHTDRMESAVKRPLESLTDKAMMRGEYVVQKEVGAGWEVDAIGTPRVEAFVKGMWNHNDAVEYLRPVSKMAMDEIATGLALGESPSRIAARIHRVDGIGRVRAERYARTVVTAVSNEAQMQSYIRRGVKMFVWHATYDERTCPVCGAMDGRTFNVADRKAGLNVPPIHPNCRCTTLPHISQEAMARISQDYVRAHPDATIGPGMTYEQWHNGEGYRPAEEPPRIDNKPKRKSKKKTKSTDAVFTGDSYSEAFNKTKSDIKSNTLFAEFIESRPDADLRMKKLFGHIGKMQEAEGFETVVKHGSNHAVTRYVNFKGTMVRVDVTTPKMRSADDTVSAHTKAHEEIHYIDLCSRKDPASTELRSGQDEALLKAIEDTGQEIGPEVKELFDRFHADLNAEKERLTKEFGRAYAELDKEFREGNMTYKEYKKRNAKIFKEYDDAVEEYGRSWSNGGVNQLEDIYDALSKGEYRDNKTVLYGHGSKYFKEDNARRAGEIFAEFGSLRLNNPELIEMLRKDHPKLVEAYDRYIDELIEHWGI